VLSRRGRGTMRRFTWTGAEWAVYEKLQCLDLCTVGHRSGYPFHLQKPCFMQGNLFTHLFTLIHTYSHLFTLSRSHSVTFRMTVLIMSSPTTRVTISLLHGPTSPMGNNCKFICRNVCALNDFHFNPQEHNLIEKNNKPSITVKHCTQGS